MEENYPKVYKKAIKGTVGGLVLNARGQEEDFLLKGDPQTSDLTQISVEILDSESDKFFVKHNKPALVNGFLIEIADGPDASFDETNAVSDGYLKDLLKLPFTKMVKKLSEFTSPVPISRLLTFALEGDKPVKTVEIIKTHLSKHDSKLVGESTGDGSVSVSTIG